MRGNRARSGRTTWRIGRPFGVLALVVGCAVVADRAGAQAPTSVEVTAAKQETPATATREALPTFAAPPEVLEETGAGEAGRREESAGPAPVRAAPAPSESKLESAWRAPASSLEERVERTRRASLETGAWSFDPVARVIQAGGVKGTRLDAALAAVELAPDLPSAHMQLAHALWLEGDSPMATLRAVVAALQSIARHLEASLWFGGSGLFLLAVGLIGGGLLCILLAAIPALPHAAHDLGHLVSRSTPHFARAAALAALLLVPLAFGEGILGLAACLLGIAAVYGSRAQRIALALAAAGIALGAHPVARYSGVALGALSEDPVASAAHAISHGVATPMTIARLESAGDDPLALRGLAIDARRRGNLGEADGFYQRLLAAGEQDIALLNNAANVRLELGHMESAINLYDRAVRQAEDPVVLFNMAQAYGRAFQVEDLNSTLARAQNAGGDQVAKITALQGTDTIGFVVDYPIPRSLFYERTLAAQPGSELAAGLRRPFAPGHIGGDPVWMAGVLAATLLVGGWLGSRVEPSRSCVRCGGRICSRCEERGTAGELCDGCNKLFYQPEHSDRMLRIERVNELRIREQRVERLRALLAVVVPGAAGLLARRPIAAWLGATGFVLAAAAVVWRWGVVPDPLVAGTAAPTVFLGVAVVLGLVHATVVATSLGAARRSA